MVNPEEKKQIYDKSQKNRSVLLGFFFFCIFYEDSMNMKK